MNECVPHRSGPNLRVGEASALPVLFTGPHIFDWGRRRGGLPISRLDDGNLIANYPLTLDRAPRPRPEFGTVHHIKRDSECIHDDKQS